MSQWGHWKLKIGKTHGLCSSGYTLECYQKGKRVYGVDLERCQSSAQVLDWIVQVAKKPWATQAVVADLITALNAVLDPQATICSGCMCGMRPKRLPKQAIRKMCEERNLIACEDSCFRSGVTQA